jgi:hypothetical protein
VQRIRFLEDILIFLAIASLWPGYILDWPNPIWDGLMYLMLGAMVLVCFHRVKLLGRSLEERRKKGGGKL